MSAMQTGSKRHAKKSRAGCFNCKARKVKCSETRPACEGCSARDLFCIYPSKAQRMNVHRRTLDRADDAGSALTTTLPNPTGWSTFKAADFRYFHHFLTAAYPHLPSSNDGPWTFEIPQLAHQSEPLLHAILSLGASHSALLSPQSKHTTDAIEHRGLAIAGLRQMLAKSHHTSTELDIMLAICYSMLFQSAYTAGCQVDFVVMIRGCALVSGLITCNGRSTSVFNLDPTDHVQRTSQRLLLEPTLDFVLLQEGIKRLETFGHLLELDAHRRFHHALVQTLSSLQRSGMEAYTSLPDIYAVLYTMDEATFQDVVISSNPFTLILFVYFAAINVVMQPYLVHEVPRRLSMYQILGSTLGWLDSLHRRLPLELRGHVKWPFGVIKTFHCNYEAFGSDVFGLVHWALASGSDRTDRLGDATGWELDKL